MKKIVVLCLFVFCFCFSKKSHALSTIVKAIDFNGNSTTVATPSALYNLSLTTAINKIEVILAGTMTNYTVTDSAYSATNWGVSFVSSGSNTTLTCSKLTSANCGNATVTVSTTGLPTLPSQTSPYAFSNASITLDITIAFAANSGVNIPQIFSSLLANATSMSIYYVYGSSSNGPDAASWKPDYGALVNPPTLQGNNLSVIAHDGYFNVTNISPPSDLSAVCPALSSADTTCTLTSDASTATTLISTSANNVSGYVIGFWEDSLCRTSGGFKFNANWMAYSGYALPATSYTCTYSNWISSLGTGGTSSDLGCPSSNNVLPTILSNSNVTLTTDKVAIPYYTSNPKSDLKTFINNPGVAYRASDSCVSYVYLSNSGSSQASYVSGPIINGDVYGVMVWALNNAVGTDTTYPGIPNYSFAHSNIFYTTGVEFVIASRVKNAAIKTSKDCFVVTAASGNVNSPSVFYWRYLRDTYLTPMGFTKFYYKHAQNWALWLENHPSLKPPLNFIFEKSGAALYNLSEFTAKSIIKLKSGFHHFLYFIDQLLDNSANAKELENKELVLPVYDLSLDGGILMPSKDKGLYQKYYSSKPTFLVQSGLQRIFWKDSLGFSLGGQFRYVTNSQSDSVSVLGTPENYSRKFYSLSLGAVSQLRFRKIGFSLFQPGILFGLGASRLREEATPTGTGVGKSSDGVTDYSPVFELAGVLDMSLNPFIPPSELSNEDYLSDMLLRFKASYVADNGKALSLSGLLFTLGFAFLLN